MQGMDAAGSAAGMGLKINPATGSGGSANRE
jgi:hypothetical protein